MNDNSFDPDMAIAKHVNGFFVQVSKMLEVKK